MSYFPVPSSLQQSVEVKSIDSGAPGWIQILSPIVVCELVQFA